MRKSNPSLHLAVLIAALCFQFLMTVAAHSAGKSENSIKPASASARLVKSIEQDLKRLVDLLGSIDRAGTRLSEAQRNQLFDLNSKTQRRFRVLRIQDDIDIVLGDTVMEQQFLERYRGLVEGLQTLHRAVVFNQPFADPTEASLRAATETLDLLRAAKSL